MLSRTANNLYWMARYVERAENTARILDVTYRMSLMPQDPKLVTQEWFAPLNITGTPTYIIGNEIIPGAIGIDELRSRIANMRACGETQCEG